MIAQRGPIFPSSLSARPRPPYWGPGRWGGRAGIDKFVLRIRVDDRDPEAADQMVSVMAHEVERARLDNFRDE